MVPPWSVKRSHTQQSRRPRGHPCFVDRPDRHCAPHGEFSQGARMTTANPDRAHQPAGGPLALGMRGWWAVLRRTVSEFRADNISDWAAALTYYAVLSVFP